MDEIPMVAHPPKTTSPCRSREHQLALVHNRPREVVLRRVAELASVVHIKTKKSHRFRIFHQQLTNDPNPNVGHYYMDYGLLILFKKLLRSS
jgi:hypothetical protein